MIQTDDSPSYSFCFRHFVIVGLNRTWGMKSMFYFLINLIKNHFIYSSYLVIIPNLLKVDYDNQVSVYIAEMSEPVEIKFDLMVNRTHTEDKITCKLGKFS